jgi:uncharacterized membrane protein YgcG
VCTSCPGNLPGCVVGATTTEVVTLTTVYPTAVATVVPCVSGYCGTGWTFEAYPGSSCQGEVVYVVEPCTCQGGWAYSPILCTGETCTSITVYKPVPCTGSTATASVGGGNETIVFQPSSCDTCEGGVIFTQAPTSAASTPGSPAQVPATVTTTTVSATGVVAPGAGGSGSGSSGGSSGGSSSGSGSGSGSGSSGGSSSGSSSGQAGAAGTTTTVALSPGSTTASSGQSPSAVVTAGSDRLATKFGSIAAAVVAVFFLVL